MKTHVNTMYLGFRIWGKMGREVDKIHMGQGRSFPLLNLDTLKSQLNKAFYKSISVSLILNNPFGEFPYTIKSYLFFTLFFFFF
jgi:hypothetical protein